MKAAVFYGEKDIRIEEVQDPVPSEGEVLVRPRFCGICGSDLHAWNHGIYAQGVILGHEFSAEVIGTGTVSEWTEGDRVVAHSIIPCKKCSFCREGKYTLCDNVSMVGTTAHGGLAELAVLPADSLISVPETVTLREAALTEPLSVVLHGFNLIHCRPGQKVLVLGAGTIGLLSLQVAHLMGATLVAVSETNGYRRNLAERLGASVINPEESTVSLEFEALTKGQPADLVIECTGVATVAAETFSLVKKGGTVLVLGIAADPVDADFFTAILNEVRYQFSYCSYSEFPAAIELIEKGVVNIGDLITKEINLEDVVEKGFKELTTPHSDNVKVLVKSGGD